MISSAFGAPAPDMLPTYYFHDGLFDAAPSRITHSQASRGPAKTSTASHRGMSTARITKPRSANNSPRASSTLSRRKTIVDGALPRKQHQALDYLQTATHGTMMARPTSWHPCSCHQQRQAPTTSLSTTPNMYVDHQDLYSTQAQFSPMADVYSNNTSPLSSLSQLPLFPGSGEGHYFSADAWIPSQQTSPVYRLYNAGQSFPTEPVPVLESSMNQRTPARTALDWDNLMMHGFSSTSPPTPESFPHMPYSQPAVTEPAGLSEAEEEGEILVGMGLYDKFDEDPQLNNYRSTASSLFGSSLRPHEPRGKGLKLEETWEPPKSDDGEGDDEDAEETEVKDS
ncbi:hypothetical protein CDD81_2865 [Ophiocordyceps australis]|uniref:Uncharacterized protein n=1 Tax=Ophiocordyceps australis TaxID=1399860 RepID=A0A2C5XEC8_9HYPO|nr:hypothetical protein CDD81_2865 [Ophiocordyceps australis]